MDGISTQAGMIGAGRQLALSFLQHTQLGTTIDNGDETFSSVNIGAASSSRKVIVSIAYRHINAGGTITAMTVGGISGTKWISASSFVATNYFVIELWHCDVPTGTSADVVVTFSGLTTTNRSASIGIWRGENVSDALADSATATGSNTISEVLAVPNGGAAIAACHGSGDAPDATWTGDLGEDFDADPYDPLGDVHTGGSLMAGGSQTAAVTLSTSAAGATCFAAVAIQKG